VPLCRAKCSLSERGLECASPAAASAVAQRALLLWCDVLAPAVVLCCALPIDSHHSLFLACESIQQRYERAHGGYATRTRA
jgi:hypothetical protein